LGATGDQFGFVGARNGNYATFVGNSASWNDQSANTPNTQIGATSTVLSMTVNSGPTGLIPYFNGAAVGTKNGSSATSTGF
jgi:hypothetical protein